MFPNALYLLVVLATVPFSVWMFLRLYRESKSKKDWRAVTAAIVLTAIIWTLQYSCKGRLPVCRDMIFRWGTTYVVHALFVLAYSFFFSTLLATFLSRHNKLPKSPFVGRWLTPFLVTLATYNYSRTCGGWFCAWLSGPNADRGLPMPFQMWGQFSVPIFIIDLCFWAIVYMGGRSLILTYKRSGPDQPMTPETASKKFIEDLKTRILNQYLLTAFLPVGLFIVLISGVPLGQWINRTMGTALGYRTYGYVNLALLAIACIASLWTAYVNWSSGLRSKFLLALSTATVAGIVLLYFMYARSVLSFYFR